MVLIYSFDYSCVDFELEHHHDDHFVEQFLDEDFHIAQIHLISVSLLEVVLIPQFQLAFVFVRLVDEGFVSFAGIHDFGLECSLA